MIGTVSHTLTMLIIYFHSRFFYMCVHVCDYGICGMWYMRVSTYICTRKVRDGIMCPVRLCLNPLRHHLPWSLDPGWGPARSIICIPVPCPLHPALGFQMCGIMPSFLCGHYYQLSHLYSSHFYSLSVCCTSVVSMYVVHTHECARAHTYTPAQVGIRVWQNGKYLPLLLPGLLS